MLFSRLQAAARAAIESPWGASFVGLGLVAAGQSILIILAPLTRASGTFVTRSGIAYLAPDSKWYLSNSTAGGSLLETGWTTWGYLLILRAGHSLGDAAVFAVVVQASLAAAAATMLFRSVGRSAGLLAGLAAASALAVNPLTAQWVRFVLTESIFQPLVVILVVTAARLLDERDQRLILPLLGLALLGAFVRPNGVLLVFSSLVVLSMLQQRRRARFLGLLGALLVAGALLAASVAATGQPAEATFVEQLYGGVIIEGADEVRLTVSMPPTDGEATERAALTYVARHPFAIIRLGVTRMFVEVSQVRPHYPLYANLAVGAGMLLFVLAAVAGLTDRRWTSFSRAGIIFALPILLLVGATFAVPEARYGWGGLVALTPAVGVGAARVARVLPFRKTEQLAGRPDNSNR